MPRPRPSLGLGGDLCPGAWRTAPAQKLRRRTTAARIAWRVRLFLPPTSCNRFSFPGDPFAAPRARPTLDVSSETRDWRNIVTRDANETGPCPAYAGQTQGISLWAARAGTGLAVRARHQGRRAGATTHRRRCLTLGHPPVCERLSQKHGPELPLPCGRTKVQCVQEYSVQGLVSYSFTLAVA